MTDQVGPKLDALIETHIFDKTVLDEYPPGHRELMGCEILTDAAATQHCIQYDYPCMTEPTVRPFSTNVAAAWEIIDELGANWYVSLSRMASGKNQWECWLQEQKELSQNPITLIGYADTPALAICQAAMQTVAKNGNISP